MARVLIVGCGCRGRELASALVADGHAVRGTTRAEAVLAEIEAAGVQAALADPDRLATLLPHLESVSVVCWLMGSAAAAEVHGPRLQSLIEKLVDTPVRGVVYEGAGTASPELLERGVAIVRAAADTYRIPVEIVGADPSDRAAWLRDARRAVDSLLGG